MVAEGKPKAVKTTRKDAAAETKFKVKQEKKAKQPKQEAEETAAKKEKKKTVKTDKKSSAKTEKPVPAKKQEAKKEEGKKETPAQPKKEKAAADEKTTDSKEEKKEKEKPKKEKKKPKAKPIEKIKFAGERKLSDDETALLKKKPKFQRPESQWRGQLSSKWRRPRGIDSKQLEGKRGKGALPSPGYKKPKNVSGLVKGFKVKRVFNPAQAEVADPTKEALVIAKGVGRRKRNEIIKTANQKKITILNPRKGEI